MSDYSESEEIISADSKPSSQASALHLQEGLLYFFIQEQLHSKEIDPKDKEKLAYQKQIKAACKILENSSDLIL